MGNAIDDDLNLVGEDARERLVKILFALRDWTRQLQHFA